MPFCPTHGTPLIYDVYGNAACERCEVQRKADEARRCRGCSAPIPEPGLCPACARVRRGRRVYDWMGDNGTWLGAAILIVALLVVFWAFAAYFLPAIDCIRHRPDPCY